MLTSLYRRWPLLAALASSVAAAGTSDAAEIRLRPEATARTALVTLGDIAEVFAAGPQEQQRLMGTALFPAPTAGSQRFVRLTEVQDILLLRGENLRNHTFSGASQTRLVPAGERRGPTAATSAYARRVAEDRLRQAMLRHWPAAERSASPEDWELETQLEPQQIELINQTPDPLNLLLRETATDGSGLWEMTTPAGHRSTFRARLRPVARAVVTKRTVRRGTVLRPEDLDLGPVPEGVSNYFTEIDDVVGQETSVVLSAGQTVSGDVLQRPTLVERGQIVTVFARTAGITVRSTARAQESGAQGDLIAVESLLDRQRFFARVSGVQEVEVYARSARPAASPAPARSAMRREGTLPRPTAARGNRLSSETPVSVASTQVSLATNTSPASAQQTGLSQPPVGGSAQLATHHTWRSARKDR